MADERKEALAFIRRLPKVDLHLHLEGSLSRRAMSRLAARHRIAAPDRRGLRGFDGFLKAFAAACDLMRDADDFRLAVEDVLRNCGRQGVVHVEIRFSPQVFLRRGIPLGSMLRGLLEGRRRGAARHGVSSVLIVDGVRQWGPDWFHEMVRSISPHAGKGIAAIGLGGHETSLDASVFAHAFRQGRRLGLRSTVHAGETGGPDSVWAALRSLQPDRIGHGVRAILDPRLIREMARRRITLEVCPTSNVRTGAVRSLAAHPVRDLFEAGVPIAVGADDGAIFGTDLDRELRILVTRFGFTREELGRMMIDAARASFLGGKAGLALRARIMEAVRRTASG